MFITALLNRSRKLTVLASTSFLLLLVLIPTVRGLPADPATGTLQWLQVSGASIVREDGSAMILRGANLPELDPSGPSPERYALYLEAAKSMGFNIVRLPISWGRLEPTRGVQSTSYLNLIQKIVTLSEKKEVYLVVDMHLYKTHGFPSWTNFKTEDQAALGFWNNPALQAELIQTWKTLASRLNDRKVVAGYDLLNEPYAGPISWQEFAPILNSYYSKLITEIRGVDSKHIIFFEPVDGTCVLGDHVALRPEGMNLVFSPHFYIQGPKDYLENAISRLYNLTINSWNIPIWIGEFGGVIVGIKDQDSLSNLGFTLDLFDQYKLGWAYWSLAETNRNPTLVDGTGQSSPLLTAIVARIYPTAYTAQDLAFSYNSTPRFHLEASAMSEGIIRISVPHTLASTVARCINCDFSKDGDGLSLIVRLADKVTAQLYLDVPDTVNRLRQLAASDLQQARSITEALRDTQVLSSRSRQYVDEIMTLVGMMQGNFTVGNYELVLGKLNQARELFNLASDEEKNHAQTSEYVDSVKQGILGSQGFLDKWQSTLLSHAYESLAQGNYTWAEESAKNANDLPRENPQGESDGLLNLFLWRASLGLLVTTMAFISLASFKRQPHQKNLRQSCSLEPWRTVRENACRVVYGRTICSFSPVPSDA